MIYMTSIAFTIALCSFVFCVYCVNEIDKIKKKLKIDQPSVKDNSTNN